MANLKPCPFCGGEAKVCDDIEYTVGGYWVECKDCHIQTPSKINSKEAVINYWNTRKPMEAVVAELEKLQRHTWGVTMLTAEDYVKVADLRKVTEIVRGKE